MRIRASGNRIVVLPDRHRQVEVEGHGYDIDARSGLILAGDTARTTGVVLDVGPTVDEPLFVGLRERLSMARETGQRVESVRVLWIRDKSLTTSVDGVDYAFLCVPTAEERRECRVCRAAKYRNRDEVVAVLEEGVTLEVVG